MYRGRLQKSLNLTVVLGDGAAGAVGAGRPEVWPTATSPGIVTSAQVRGVAEHDQDLVKRNQSVPVAMIQKLCVRVLVTLRFLHLCMTQIIQHEWLFLRSRFAHVLCL